MAQPASEEICMTAKGKERISIASQNCQKSPSSDLRIYTHPASKKKSLVGVTRAGVVYELFFTNLPQQAFPARDVVELYLHRGAFEPPLLDEDIEQDPDRWCSHSAWGQDAGK